jgi:hypothetical protein
MTRRTFLVPLFAAALILAPSKISGKIAASPLADGAFQVAGASPRPTSPPQPPSPISHPASGRGGS